MGTCFSKPAAARGEPDAALQRDTACDPVPADLGQIEAVIPIAWRPSGCPKVAPATTIDIDVNCKADDEFAETKAYDSPCAKDAKQSSGRRRSLKETLFPALAQPAVDPQEMQVLREKLEQAEWTLLDMKTLTSTDAYQLMSSIMKVVDEYEEAQTEYAANRTTGDDRESQSTDYAACAQRVLQLVMRFRQQGLVIHNDVNDEVIEESGLDTQAKRWLTNEFTRSSIIRPTRFSFSLTNQPRQPLPSTPEAKANSDSGIPTPNRLSIPGISDESILGGLDSENFDVFAYSLENLDMVAFAIFHSAGVMQQYSVTSDMTLSLIRRISKAYINTNPFHNFYHGVDVLQTCYFMYKRSGLDAISAGWQKLGFLVAALAHDIGHPGTNNLFQVNTGSKLALLYNDQSVLENHHAATLYSILTEPEYNILAEMKSPIKSEVRSVILSCIMATDMKFHFELVAKGDMVFEKIKMYKKHASDSRPNLSSTFDEARKKEVKLALNIMMHCADINNVCKEWPQAKRWSDLCIAEFWNQGDLERQMHLPVSPYMDRRRDSQAEMSLNFIDFIAAPLIACIADAFENMDFMVRNMLSVRENWSRIRIAEVKKLPSSVESERQLDLIHSRDEEFDRNFVARVMHKRSSVTKTVAMLQVRSQFARRNSLMLARDLELLTEKKGNSSGSKSDHEFRRSSSAEDLINRQAPSGRRRTEVA